MPPPRPVLVQMARVALDMLGRTPGDIARTLTVEGFTGQCKSMFDCPISRLLVARLGAWGVAHVGVIPTKAVMYGPTSERGDGVPELGTLFIPPPVASFIRLFDDREYPGLIESAP